MADAEASRGREVGRLRAGGLGKTRWHRPTRRRDAVLGSALLGAASGLRAQLAVATVVARSDPSLPPVFRRPWTRRLLVAAAAAELVGDKLPTAPSRLEPPGLAGRLAMGALAAGLFAQTRQAA